MASRQDMQDIMGLPAAGASKAPAMKRPKPAPPVKRMTGISREVVALMGERPPPVAIYDEKKAYKARRHTGPAKKWQRTPFYNPARRDDLILSHWRRKALVRSGPEGGDVIMDDADIFGPFQVERNYEFAKYNVQVDVPGYTAEEYEEHLKSDDWSKEETDYLFGLVKDFHYRWSAIWDRYDYQAPEPPTDSTEPSTAVAVSKPRRTMEDLKQRFYSAQAVIMTLKTPISNMTAAEFSLHELLSKYNTETETNRKALAAALLTRTREEVVEEEFLLVELQRICASAERLEAERDEIRAVHEHPTSASSANQFQSSQALHSLFQQLFQQDRSKKRQSAGGAGAGRLSLNTSDLMTPNGLNTPASRGDGLGSANAHKKGSGSAQQQARTLSAASERRFGVTSHDRLQSGVTFRSDKILKLRQAKSQAQTTKLLNALTELGIPDIIVMSSQATLEAFEKTVHRTSKLLEARKLREKEEAELKTLTQLVANRRRELAAEGGEAYEEEEGAEGNKDDVSARSKTGDPGDDTTKTGDAGNGTNADADVDDDDDGGEADGKDESELPNADNDSDAENQGEDDDDDDAEPEAAGSDEDMEDAEAEEPEPELDNDDDDDDSVPDYGDGEADDTPRNVDDEDDEDAADAPDEEDAANGVDEDDEDADADGDTETNGNTRPPSVSVDAPPSMSTRAGHKRSASVLSGASSKASKRTRK